MVVSQSEIGASIVAQLSASSRQAMKRQGLKIETRDVKHDASAGKELLSGGGDLKVPCLRIEDGEGEVRWMYESGDIIRYLEGRFSSANAVALRLR